jgi:Mn-dependent DtxR family transcriptional regulator
LTDLDDPQPRPLSALHRRWNRRLRSVAGVRGELARLYGEAREGLVDPQTATRLCHLLVAIVRMDETVEIEERIARLEELFGPTETPDARPPRHRRH